LYPLPRQQLLLPPLLLLLLLLLLLQANMPPAHMAGTADHA
jgi:hypothetical protein